MSSTRNLTPRQAAFIPEFLATGNATASAIAAGFSVKGASQLSLDLGALRSALIGSDSQAVLHASKVPVTIVKHAEVSSSP